MNNEEKEIDNTETSIQIWPFTRAIVNGVVRRTARGRITNANWWQPSTYVITTDAYFIPDAPIPKVSAIRAIFGLVRTSVVWLGSAVGTTGGAVVLVFTASVAGGYLLGKYIFVPNGNYQSAAPLRQIRCKDTIFKRVYKCIDDQYSGSDNPRQYYECDVQNTPDGELYNDEQIVTPLNFTPEYTCNCIRSNGETYQGSITLKRWSSSDLLSEGMSLDNVQSLGLYCEWFVTEVRGKPGSTCTCTLPNPLDTLFNQSMSPELVDMVRQSNAINLNPIYTYTIPEFNPDKFTVESRDIRDCIKATEQCQVGFQGGCDGFYCCDSMRIYVYEVVGAGNDSFVCNIGKDIPPPNTCPGASIVRFDRCNDDSTDTIPVALYRINKKLKDCSDVVDNISLFVNEREAEAVVKNAIGPQGVAVVYRYEERDSRDPADISQIAPPIMSGNIQLVPALYKHAKYVFTTAYKLSNLNDPCNVCKILYTVTEGSGDYPCDDRNINRDEFCGWSAGCNISNSTDSTPYKKAIITQKTRPTQSDINNITNERGGFYDDFGTAMSDAEALISPRGIVISSPCPP